jgi:hypothetical protein
VITDRSARHKWKPASFNAPFSPTISDLARLGRTSASSFDQGQ